MINRYLVISLRSIRMDQHQFPSATDEEGSSTRGSQATPTFSQHEEGVEGAGDGAGRRVRGGGNRRRNRQEDNNSEPQLKVRKE